MHHWDHLNRSPFQSLRFFIRNVFVGEMMAELSISYKRILIRNSLNCIPIYSRQFEQKQEARSMIDIKYIEKEMSENDQIHIRLPCFEMDWQSLLESSAPITFLLSEVSVQISKWTSHFKEDWGINSFLAWDHEGHLSFFCFLVQQSRRATYFCKDSEDPNCLLEQILIVLLGIYSRR